MDLYTLELLFKPCISQKYAQNFEKTCKTSVCTGANNLDKSVSF